MANPLYVFEQQAVPNQRDNEKREDPDACRPTADYRVRRCRAQHRPSGGRMEPSLSNPNDPACCCLRCGRHMRYSCTLGGRAVRRCSWPIRRGGKSRGSQRRNRRAIGAHSVASAAPDGYTLLVGQTAEVAINQHWLKGLNYDPDKDLIPVALAAVVPLALVVPAKAPYSTLPEFLAALKAKPKMTFASAGLAHPVTSRASCSNCSSTTI
jgi:hypothetical protein